MRSIITLLFLLPLQIAPVRSQKVHFFNGSFEAALKEAEKTNRYVFIDVYTDWCKPCRQMDKEVFADADVASLMNAFFVNFKADAEGVGKNAAVRYNVNAYPTLLFVSPQGNIFETVLGSRSKDAFINIAENVVRRTDYGQIFRRFEMVWKQGNREPEFVSEFIKLRNQYGFSNETILEDYLGNLSPDSLDLQQTEKLVILGTTETKGVGFDYLLAHKSSRRCSVKLNSLLSQLADRAVKDENRSAFDEYLLTVGKVTKTDWEAELKRGEFQSRFFLETGKKDSFVLFANRFAPEVLLPNLNPERLSADSVLYACHRLALENIGWQFAHYIKNKEALQTAFDWLEQLNQTHPSLNALCHQAMIADKMGNEEQCCKKLEAAKMVALSQNTSFEEWEKMLRRCK